MKILRGHQWTLAVFFLLSIPAWVRAGNGKPAINFKHCYPRGTTAVADTVPQPIKTADKAEAKPAETVIKVVPKVRKQAIPVPVIPTVKPVKIIKPKIVRPVLKILR
jgi:hypothetical protein